MLEVRPKILPIGRQVKFSVRSQTWGGGQI